MTKITLNALFIVSSIWMYGCSTGTENQSQNDLEVVTEELVTEVAPIPAVCIWDNIFIRESPSQKGKTITRISVGESLFYLGKDTTVDKRAYAFVKLNDGKEGWALKNFIVNDAKPAVVMTDISLYSRPDLLTKLDKPFKMMDIVSSIEVQGDWMKIKGRRSGAKWMDEGWVKSNNISFDAIDIAVAKFGLKALAIEEGAEKIDALNEIINNPDLSNSKFIETLTAALSELNTPEEVDAEGMENEMDANVDEVLPTDSIE